ncbi:apoptosis-stimulating of p53 protein 1-like isoform X1 [Diadema antillarum]|uniref:apoptosis-stimulating of p53 protein 1-like isoform X1 n=1 Tax=Diadema antillarum TaxID=105358 RepID=UPI003A888199
MSRMPEMDHLGLPGQMILKVYLSNSPDTVSDVPVTPETTCQDVIEFCKEPGEDQCHLAELWRGCERPVGEGEKIYDILQQWGIHCNEVKFFLRHEGVSATDDPGRRQKKKPGIKDGNSTEDLKGGSELNLNELRDMASRQQQQIEMQQQMLVAKQQRLKFLKQQEVKHQQVAVENERLRRLREKVEQQEMKLQRLRVMQGQADTVKVTNTNLSAELDDLRGLFREKEQELAKAVAKVDHLTQQLENLRRGNGSSLQSSAASQELDRLRKELLHRNKMNEQQSIMVENQKKALAQRNGEMVLVDKRIGELTDLLRRKRTLQQQQRQSPVPSSQRSSPSNNSNNNAMTRNMPNGNIAPRRASDHGLDRNSPHMDNGGQYPGQRPPVAPRPNRLVNGDGSDAFRQKPVPANKPVPAPKPSMLQHPGFKPRTGSSVPVTGPQGTPMVIPQSQMDASGSETSSLTENSSLDSVPSSTGPSGMRQGGNLASSNRPGAGSPSQGNANRWPAQNRDAQNRSPITMLPGQDGQISNINKDLRVQVQRNLPMSQNDPRGNYLFNRPAGDRSPMYSPSGQPSSSVWEATDLDSRPLPPQQPQGALRHPPSPQGKKAPPPPPARSENTRLTSFGSPSTTPSSSVAGAPYPNQSFYSQATSRGSESPSTVPAGPSADSTDATRPHHQRSAATVGMYAPPPNAHDRNYNRPSFEQGFSNPPYYPSRPANFQPSGLFPISDMQGDEGDDAPISPNRPASPVKFPTLTLQRYMDPKRIHNMPRPLKKRLSYTESKDENFSFLNAELRKKLPFFQPEHPQAPPEAAPLPGQQQPQQDQKQPDQGGQGGVTLTPVAAPEVDDNQKPDVTPPEDSKSEPAPPESNKSAEEPSSKYRNDAILSHKQYQKALSQYSRSPILDQTKKPQTKIKGILKNPKSKSKGIRVRFDPLALLLDASLEGEFSLVRQIIPEVSNPSGANDEGITALHNAICANHYEIVNFLIQYGVDVNSPDSDGWTPLHCAASCNNIIMVRNLVEHGACLYSTTISDRETPAQKCEEDEEGFQGCSDYLFGVQNKMGTEGNPVYAVYTYNAEKEDELGFRDGDELQILRKGDEEEKEWWWAKIGEKEGYIPRNLLASRPRVKPLYR